jgi:hypothetical protein
MTTKPMCHLLLSLHNEKYAQILLDSSDDVIINVSTVDLSLAGRSCEGKNYSESSSYHRRNITAIHSTQPVHQA